MKRSQAITNLQHLYFIDKDNKNNHNSYLRKDHSDYSLDILPTYYENSSASWNEQLEQMNEVYELSCDKKINQTIPTITIMIVQQLICSNLSFYKS